MKDCLALIGEIGYLFFGTNLKREIGEYRKEAVTYGSIPPGRTADALARLRKAVGTFCPTDVYRMFVDSLDTIGTQGEFEASLASAMSEATGRRYG